MEGIAKAAKGLLGTSQYLCDPRAVVGLSLQNAVSKEGANRVRF
jgi:hypothetical protein